MHCFAVHNWLHMLKYKNLVFTDFHVNLQLAIEFLSIPGLVAGC